MEHQPEGVAKDTGGEERERISFEEAWAELQTIFGIVEDLGLRRVEFYRDSKKIKELWTKRFSFPIVRDGLEGVLVKPMPDGHFRVWFDRGCEDPDNPIRIKVMWAMLDHGIDVRRVCK